MTGRCVLAIAVVFGLKKPRCSNDVRVYKYSQVPNPLVSRTSGHAQVMFPVDSMKGETKRQAGRPASRRVSGCLAPTRAVMFPGFPGSQHLSRCVCEKKVADFAACTAAFSFPAGRKLLGMRLDATGNIATYHKSPPCCRKGAGELFPPQHWQGPVVTCLSPGNAGRFLVLDQMAQADLTVMGIRQLCSPESAHSKHTVILPDPSSWARVWRHLRLPPSPM